MTPRPKLIVAIAVDQLSADLFAQYRGHFTGGLARLASGAVFPSGYQGARRDRDLPRPFDHPVGIAPGAQRRDRQQLA